MTTKYSKEFQIPTELPQIIRDLTREILRSQPDDINKFGKNFPPIIRLLQIFNFFISIFSALEYFETKQGHKNPPNNNVEDAKQISSREKATVSESHYEALPEVQSGSKKEPIAHQSDKAPVAHENHSEQKHAEVMTESKHTEHNIENKSVPAPQSSRATESKEVPAPHSSRATESKEVPAPHSSRVTESKEVPAPQSNKTIESKEVIHSQQPTHHEDNTLTPVASNETIESNSST